MLRPMGYPLAQMVDRFDAKRKFRGKFIDETVHNWTTQPTAATAVTVTVVVVAAA